MMSYQPQTERAYCPQCNAYIPLSSAYCPNCMVTIQRCTNCSYFIYPNRPNCVRCGAYVQPYIPARPSAEPLVTAEILVEGGGIVGDNETIKLQIKNVGTMPTDVYVKIDGPKEMEPHEFEDDTIKDLRPGQSVQRTYQFTVNKPGEYVIESIEISYLKSSRERERITVTPVKFKIYGRPNIQLTVVPENCTIPLGEVAKTYVVLKNIGSTAALFVKLESAYPTSVQIQDPVITLPELKPDEERAALFRIRPLFTGNHTCKIRATYLSPAMDQLAPVGFETVVKTINITAEMQEKLVSPEEKKQREEPKPSKVLAMPVTKKREG